MTDKHETGEYRKLIGASAAGCPAPWVKAGGVYHRHHGVDFPSPRECPYCQLDRLAETILPSGDYDIPPSIQADRCLNRLDELEEKLRWIPVEERLPETKDADNAFDVLAWGPDGAEMVDIRYQSDWTDYTHWMPIPEGPGE